jgi:hypothetical protein
MTTTFFIKTVGGMRRMAGWVGSRVMIVVRHVVVVVGEMERRWFSVSRPVWTLPAPFSHVSFVVAPLVVAWLRWEQSVKVTTRRPVVFGWRYLNVTWRTKRGLNEFTLRVACWEQVDGRWALVGKRLVASRRHGAAVR